MEEEAEEAAPALGRPRPGQELPGAEPSGLCVPHSGPAAVASSHGPPEARLPGLLLMLSRCAASRVLGRRGHRRPARAQRQSLRAAGPLLGLPSKPPLASAKVLRPFWARALLLSTWGSEGDRALLPCPRREWCGWAQGAAGSRQPCGGQAPGRTLASPEGPLLGSCLGCLGAGGNAGGQRFSWEDVRWGAGRVWGHGGAQAQAREARRGREGVERAQPAPHTKGVQSVARGLLGQHQVAAAAGTIIDNHC